MRKRVPPPTGALPDLTGELQHSLTLTGMIAEVLGSIFLSSLRKAFKEHDGVFFFLFFRLHLREKPNEFATKQ